MDDDLDQLLDDALDGFGPSHPPVQAQPRSRQLDPHPPTASTSGPSLPPRRPRPGQSFNPLPARPSNSATSPHASPQSHKPAPPSDAQPTASAAAGVRRRFDPLRSGPSVQADGASAGLGSVGGPEWGQGALADGLAKLMEELAVATDAEGGHSHAAIRGAGPGTAAAPPTTDFTATLRQMAQAGADAAAQGASPPNGGGDGGMEGMLAGMLAQMQAAVEGQGDPGSVAEMDDFTAAIMRNLLSKEILYPSMSEIREEYPGWLDRNAASLPAEELARYEQQHAYVGRICTHFEQHGDSRHDDMMILLQQMQALGTPPQEIVDKLSRNDGGSGMPEAPQAGCPMQ